MFQDWEERLLSRGVQRVLFHRSQAPCHPARALCLCLVQVSVGALNQGAEIPLRDRRSAEVADAAGDAGALAAMLQGVGELGEPVQECLAVSLKGEDKKLISAVSVAPVAAAGKDLLQLGAHLVEEPIAIGMAVGVVALLEGIDVEESNGQIPAKKPRIVLPQGVAVQNPGESVRAALLIQLILFLLLCEPVLLRLEKTHPAKPVDKAADGKQHRDVQAVLPGDGVPGREQNEDDAEDVEGDIPDKGRKPQVRDEQNGDIKCGRRVQASGLAPVSRPQKEEILKGVS